MVGCMDSRSPHLSCGAITHTLSHTLVHVISHDSSSSLTAQDCALEADKALLRTVPYFDVKRKVVTHVSFLRFFGLFVHGVMRRCMRVNVDARREGDAVCLSVTFPLPSFLHSPLNRRRTFCSSRRGTTACAASSTACPSSPPTPARSSARATPRHVIFVVAIYAWRGVLMCMPCAILHAGRDVLSFTVCV